MDVFTVSCFEQMFKESKDEVSLFRKFDFMGYTVEIYFGNYRGGLDFDVKKDSLFLFGRKIGGLNKSTTFHYLN